MFVCTGLLLCGKDRLISTDNDILKITIAWGNKKVKRYMIRNIMVEKKTVYYLIKMKRKKLTRLKH